jgi:hypothetical protein
MKWGLSPSKLAGLSRRSFFRHAATASGGVLLGSALPSKASAEQAASPCGLPGICDFPLPIPHINTPPPGGGHLYFPGPVSGGPTPFDPCTGTPVDPSGTHPEGRDPSVIFNFRGFVGQADLCLSGTGTDLTTGASAPYKFHTDMRFMHGVFVGTDLVERHGSFVFV